MAARHAADSYARKLRVIAGLVAGLAVAGAGLAATASADPITCPNGQASEKVAGEWSCVNGGGNTSNADETRNPTD